ncbi:MAG: hypothetical protein DI551_11815, partial [Micavibrio aeruginosavorus]
MIMIGLTAINVFSVTALQQYLMYQDNVQTTQASLGALKDAKEVQLEEYFSVINKDIAILAESDVVKNAMQDFGAGWAALGGSQTAQLQKLYIEDNKNPTGQKDNLDMASDGSIYSMVHGKYHPWLHKFLKEKAYYDIFLISPNGDVMYTVFKERDYATNVMTGEWKDTDLGKIFRDVKANPKADYVGFTDFAPYAPSYDAPAGFIGKPLIQDGRFIGALVFQMPIDYMSNLAANADGMGETGASYLVGADHLMRSNFRFSKESTILKEKVDEEGVVLALQGKEGVILTTDEHTGEKAYMAYAPIDFHGTRWAYIVEQLQSESLASYHEV